MKKDSGMTQCFFLQEREFLGQRRSAYRDPAGEGAWGMYGREAVSGRIGDLSRELKRGKDRKLLIMEGVEDVSC